MERLTVIGGGLAGCEAAWQAAHCGVEVDLYEMRPRRSGPAHKTGDLAELVCSNSFRGAALENAVGLLKEELARLGSIIITSAREAAVPAGGALAVDRAQFSALIESRIAAEPRIALHRDEIQGVPLDRPAIVACGPLPGDEFLTSLDAVIGKRLHYFDAASPIVAADSIDEEPMYRKSRYDKGEGEDYLNIPLNRDQYLQLVADLRTLERHPAKDFEETRYFEGCLPIEEMADRGDDVLRFGPLKPVGLRDPRTGRTPHAVVQLRKENRGGTAYNLVGFQTRLAWPAQRDAFGKLPGLREAEWLRLGVMHRNTFIDAPRLLEPSLRLRGTNSLYFAGQITGAEGYVEAAACGAMAGIHAARAMLGMPPVEFPRESAFGAVVAHLQNRATPDFQPSNVTWGAFDSTQPFDCGAARRAQDDGGEGKRLGKRERRRILAERALAAIDAFAAETLYAPAGYSS
ncbi:MAG TPA: methylenetetrahydrofolate--tRNA-(uracil(54)-C(5))-methyltransferase (FADH(2)-oxidizing) TrmFO [Candidatus Cybelea sp.]|jgi:methylenetetrahydrofolate--tRNA-(uracil-5-)-methyltransferase|nr:methylenetetrahydrofolate--tRNA-(uracil(54)-C(5))-methyltransferase (FADH(2)-oxidizing) TrmFO [Candidatus Cybelea sp.]